MLQTAELNYLDGLLWVRTMPTSEFVVAGKSNPKSTNISTPSDEKRTYNTNLFPVPLKVIYDAVEKKALDKFALTKYHNVSPVILSRFGTHEWCRSPKKDDPFKFSVFIIDLQKNRFPFRTRKYGKNLLGHLEKMNQLYEASFDDEKEVWDSFLRLVQKNSVNICVMITPQKKGNFLKDVHPLVIASVTAKVCQEFIVPSALSVRSNEFFETMEDHGNRLTDVQQGDPDKWQGLGLGRFLIQFLAFYHYHFYKKEVPILVQTAENNGKAKAFYDSLGFQEVTPITSNSSLSESLG